MDRVPALIVLLALMVATALPTQAAAERKRIFVVSSYHTEYLWSQSTQEGLNQAMLDYGYFQNASQAKAFTRDNYVETPKAVVKKRINPHPMPIK